MGSMIPDDTPHKTSWRQLVRQALKWLLSQALELLRNRQR